MDYLYIPYNLYDIKHDGIKHDLKLSPELQKNSRKILIQFCLFQKRTKRNEEALCVHVDVCVARQVHFNLQPQNSLNAASAMFMKLSAAMLSISRARC